MRGQDPLGNDTLRLWQDAVRVRVCAWSSFACPDGACAAALKRFCGARTLHEVGAGTGYWAAFLRSRGLRVTATDSRPVDGPGPANEYHSRLAAWCPVAQADAAVAAAAAGKEKGVLFLCYPPPPPGACMGLAAVRAFECAGGSMLALVGEVHGDTGSAGLERHLAAGWVLQGAPLWLPAYADTVSCLTLWRLGGYATTAKISAAASTATTTPTASTQSMSATAGVPAAIGGLIPVRAKITGQPGSPLCISLQAKVPPHASGTGQTRSCLAVATSRPTLPADLTRSLGSLGGSAFALQAADVEVLLAPGLFVALGEVKAARREAVGALVLAMVEAGGRDGSEGGENKSSSSSRSSISISDSSSSSSSIGEPKWPLACAACGTTPSLSSPQPFLRDRPTRAVVACCEACARHPVCTAALEAALAMRHLPPLRVWEGLGVRGSGAGGQWRAGVLL